MGWGALLGAVAGPILGKVLGGDDDRTTTTKVEMPAWQQSAMQNAISGMQNAPTFYMNPDQQTAGMNPWLMESLGQAAGWAGGQGADQVAMMNLMGMNQANMGDMLTALAGDQAGLGMLQSGMGAGFAGGAGNWLMNQLQNGVPSSGGGGGGGGGLSSPSWNSTGPVDHLKFQYDQGTYDTIMDNLSGIAQNSFDSYAGKTKTNNLFSNAPGLQIGTQLLGGANSKVGQGSALLDAMTNQQITDFGAQMAQWAGGQANQGAMDSGKATLSAQTNAYGANVGANASMANARTAAEAAMANARTAANASMYNAQLSSAASMFGYGAGMMGDATGSYNGATSAYNGAANSLGYANGAYGDAGKTFGDANTQGINNINTSLGAGNYVQQYDQNALDRYNDALMYNGNIDFDRNKDMLAVLNGVPTGSSTTGPSPNNLNQWASLGMMAGNQIFNQPATTGGWNAAQAGHSNPFEGDWM
jgi:hypothetical protein